MKYNNHNKSGGQSEVYFMDWITVQEAANLWGITKRQAQYLCADGKINGAVKLGSQWVIPKGTQKPIDGRTKAARLDKNIVIKTDGG
jgi:excisionase family DNA binding protein